MFRRIVAFLTLAAMTLHAALGCGWHHAHARDGGGASCRAAAERHCRAGHEHPVGVHAGHRHEGRNHEPGDDRHGGPLLAAPPVTCDHHGSPGECPAGHCLEGSCKYVRAVEVQPPSQWECGEIWRDAGAAPVADGVILASRCEAALDAALFHNPCQPRCEVTQVWRI